jgi:hypothetical protein
VVLDDDDRVPALHQAVEQAEEHVEREFEPIRYRSTRMAAVNPLEVSTSGRPCAGMKFCRNAV